MNRVGIDTLFEPMLALLRSRGAAGGTSDEMSGALGISMNCMSRWLTTAKDAGLIGSWPEPRGRCHNRRRWYAIEFRPARRPPKPAALRSIHEQSDGTAWRKKPAPAQASHTEPPKVIVGPSLGYDPRYQLPPGERVIGGFASLGVGRYLEDRA